MAHTPKAASISKTSIGRLWLSILDLQNHLGDICHWAPNEPPVSAERSGRKGVSFRLTMSRTILLVWHSLVVSHFVKRSPEICRAVDLGPEPSVARREADGKVQFLFLAWPERGTSSNPISSAWPEQTNNHFALWDTDASIQAELGPKPVPQHRDRATSQWKAQRTSLYLSEKNWMARSVPSAPPPQRRLHFRKYSKKGRAVAWHRSTYFRKECDWRFKAAAKAKDQSVVSRHLQAERADHRGKLIGHGFTVEEAQKLSERAPRKSGLCLISLTERGAGV